jgi:hypothetical protein
MHTLDVFQMSEPTCRHDLNAYQHCIHPHIVMLANIAMHAYEGMHTSLHSHKHTLVVSPFG